MLANSLTVFSPLSASSATRALNSALYCFLYVGISPLSSLMDTAFYPNRPAQFSRYIISYIERRGCKVCFCRCASYPEEMLRKGLLVATSELGLTTRSNPVRVISNSVKAWGLVWKPCFRSGYMARFRPLVQRDSNRRAGYANAARDVGTAQCREFACVLR